jgi:sortase (surface protein transpeptidase)
MRFLRALPSLVFLLGLFPSLAVAATPTTTHPVATPAVEAPARPAAEEASEVTGLPVRLRIPAIGVDADVEHVGLSEDGAMASPQSYFAVGWYQFGFRPGQVGNAVMAGHIDSATQGAAVFYWLSSLYPGALVIVTDSAGYDLVFEVIGAAEFYDGEAPVFDIFGPADTANLNLITCVGTFDRSVGQYDKRYVVYTTLVLGTGGTPPDAAAEEVPS